MEELEKKYNLIIVILSLRAITKILGDWWANLEKKDQDPFKSLASNVSNNLIK